MKYPANRKNYLQSYYSRHKEKSLEQSKKWREDNPEKFKNYNYNYYLNHNKGSEKIRTYLHSYYLKNKERIIKRSKEWKRNNPERVKEIFRRYRETHKTESVNGKVLNLKELFLQDYGADLERKDRNYQEGNRVFCLDCADRKDCKGFESCEYRNEVLGVIRSR